MGSKRDHNTAERMSPETSQTSSVGVLIRCVAAHSKIVRSSFTCTDLELKHMLFGKPIIEPDKLATIIRTEVLPMARTLKKRHEKKNDLPSAGRRTFRTRALKTVLRRKALPFPDIRVFPDKRKHRKNPTREWLLDLVWWNDRPGMKGVELAVESEWNTAPNEVLYDFEKLMGMKAPLKLMVYRVTKNSKAQLKEQMERYLAEFRQNVAGENYVLCEFHRVRGEAELRCNCYLYVIRRSGRIKRPKRKVLFENVEG